MTIQTPKVSVIIAVRQGQEQVAAAIGAVRDQTWSDLELIVVDDASDDDTTAAALQAVGTDLRCSVVTMPERVGATRARWAGLAVARGDHIWFADVDDTWSHSFVEVMASAARRTNADIVTCRARRVERNGRSRIMEGAERLTFLARHERGVAVLDGRIRGYLWNKLFSRSVLPALDRCPLSSQDDFLIVLDALEESHRIVLLPDVLYTYRESPASISSTDRAQLANTATCHQEAVQRCRSWGIPPDSAAWDRFALWFWIVPTLTTPAHRGWDPDSCVSWTAPARSALTCRRLRRSINGSRRVWLHALSIKLLGPAFSRTYRRLGGFAGFSIH